MPAPGEISRNRLQIPTLLAAIEEFRFDCCIGGARRDEEKARAKERFFSFRDSFGQWDPKNQRPEIWNLYNARLNPGENMRVFPLSNWTEMDVWEYIRKEKLEVPSIYFSHARKCVRRSGQWLPGQPTCVPPEAAAKQVEETSSSASAPSATSSAPADRVAAPTAWTTSSPRSPPRASPNAAPAPTTRPPKPRWKTARKPVTSNRSRCNFCNPFNFHVLTLTPLCPSLPITPSIFSASTPAARWMTASPRSSAGCSTTPRSLMEDQIEALERSADITGGGQINLANLTDGLRAEREQGITIDVAYRYFATPRRKFIVADTPGHVQYTRNMVTGASTANLSIVLVDARQGVIEQSRRHTCIASLLRIPHLVIAVNKMDLVDWSEERFIEIRDQFEEFLPRLDVKDVQVHPPERAQRRQRRRALHAHALVSRPHAAGPPGKRPHRQRLEPQRLPPARAMGQSPEQSDRSRSCTTSAASAARSPAASCASARKSWCCPAGWSAP